MSEELIEALQPIPRRASEESGGERATVYRGSTTGLEVLRTLRQTCDSFLDNSGVPLPGAAEIVDALDTNASSSFEGRRLASRAELAFSSEAAVRRWIDTAFEQAFVLWPFVDREALNQYVEQLYVHHGLEGGEYDPDRVGLLHAAIALGQRHDANLIKLDGKRFNSVENRG